MSLATDPYIQFFWLAIKTLLLVSLSHLAITILLALFIRNNNEWWERKGPSKLERLVYYSSNGFAVTYPIFLYGGILWLFVNVSLSTILSITAGVSTRFAFESLFKKYKKRKTSQLDT